MSIGHNMLISGGKLIGEGSDGCVHDPALFSCNIENNMKNKYVSKLQFDDIYVDNECNASILIKKNYANKNSYINRFSVILEKCTKNFDEIHTRIVFHQETCSFFKQFEKYNHDDYKYNMKFAITIYEYIPGYTLNQFFDFKRNISLYKDKSNKDETSNENELKNKQIVLSNNIFLYFKQVILKFFYLQKSIYMLFKINIIHNDLHGSNIMINTDKNKIPIIIDFGRSFIIDLKHEKSYHDFFSYFNKFKYTPERTRDSFDSRFIGYICLKHKLFLPSYDNNSHKNFLNKNNIDIFITDIITNDFASYQNMSKTTYDFSKIVIMYKKFLQEFLYKFFDTNTFPLIHDVIRDIYSNYSLYNIDSYSIIYSFLDYLLTNYDNLSINRDIKIVNDILIKYLFVNINPIYTKTILHNNHLIFFKYICDVFNSKKFNNKEFNETQRYEYFNITMSKYFVKYHVDSCVFLENDILKSLYDNRTIFLNVFNSVLSQINKNNQIKPRNQMKMNLKINR